MAYTVYINTETKEITSIILYQPSAEPEGLRADSIHYVKHLEIENPEDFMETHYFSDDYSEIISRPARPIGHPYATWNRENTRWEAVLEDLLKNIRYTRDDLLKACDWTQLPDAYLTTVKKSEWATYRAQLRNITEPVKASPTNYLIFIDEVVWPTPPE